MVRLSPSTMFEMQPRIEVSNHDDNRWTGCEVLICAYINDFDY